MRKYLTTGLFGAILGLAVGAPADAALVSRGFLDEALENYATTTALDLKANQSDFTDLSDKIGTLPTSMEFYEYDANGTLGRTKYPTADVFGIDDNIGGMLTAILRGFSDSIGHIVLSLPEISTRTVRLSDQIGTLPEGITVQGMYEGWTDSHKTTYRGLNRISQDYTALLNDFNTPGLYSLFAKGGTITIPGFPPNSTILPLYELSNGVSKIGTLPSGNFPEFPESKKFFSWLKQPFTYPTSLAELINAIYGDAETSRTGLLPGIIAGFSLDTDGDGITDSTVGALPNFMLATTANTTATAAKTAADANTAKIGDLPTPDTTVAGMMGHPVLLNREQTIIPLYDLILWGSNGQMVINPISGATLPTPLLGLHDITHKIGTLPTEYATIGAALTAIKGIAEDAKAAALAAIPDPKTEGSTGKFVLTVDIVGDNATYRWEKIDREGETTTTTE